MLSFQSREFVGTGRLIQRCTANATGKKEAAQRTRDSCVYVSQQPHLSLTETNDYTFSPFLGSYGGLVHSSPKHCFVSFVNEISARNGVLLLTFYKTASSLMWILKIIPSKLQYYLYYFQFH